MQSLQYTTAVCWGMHSATLYEYSVRVSSFSRARATLFIHYALKYGDRGMFIFPVQLTTSRIGNLTRLIHTLLNVMTIHTYIHTSERRPYSATWYPTSFTLDSLLALRICAQHKTHGWCFTSCPRAREGFFV